MLRTDVLSANLDDTRPDGLGRGQQRSEVQVVREDDVSIRKGPSHNSSIRGSRIAYRRPMDGMNAELLQGLNPSGRKVHVDQDFHAVRNGASISFTLQAE